jgi:hypothetical protein
MPVPLWAWIAIAVGVLLIVAATVLAVVLGWRAYERRLLLRLVVRQEAVEAASSALLDSVTHLSTASDEEIQVFAEEVESVERRVFSDVRARAGIIADEMDRASMPKRLVPVADAVADAAYVVTEQAGKVGDELTGTDALDGLMTIDLALVRSYTQKARLLVTGACEVCGLDETAVYGGGLYL